MGSSGEATDQDMLTPDCYPIHLRLLGRGGLNLASGLVSSWLVPVAVKILSVGDLHAVGRGP